MKHTLTLFILFLFIPINSFATPEFSVQTKKSCISCHAKPDGGELNVYGEEFKTGLIQEGRYVPVKTRTKVSKSIAGLLHFLTAFLWLGTILYVHLILKPKYVAKGIPRGELKIGWISMIIMLITGTYLTILKFPTLDLLFNTEVGILLLFKIGLFLFMIITIFIVTFYIAPRINSKIKVQEIPERGDLTTDELAYFDGKEGRPAFVGYKGQVYDVTLSAFWYNGNHLLKHVAGMDLTLAMSLAPHSSSVLKGFVIVGNIIKQDKVKKSPIMKLFYFLAYSVLICVFGIILILSMWKWWF